MFAKHTIWYFMTKAASTRLTILQKAFELVYRNGYQATSVDDIIATTKLTKGAFFYHFKGKDEMGLAMINEVMYPGMYEVLVKPLENTNNPVKDIYAMMKHLLLTAPFFDVKYGCPAVNLVEEMAPLNDKFKHALNMLLAQWQQAIKLCLTKGVEDGKIKNTTNPGFVAVYITACYGGVRNMGKLQGTEVYKIYLKEFKNYLEGLR